MRFLSSRRQTKDSWTKQPNKSPISKIWPPRCSPSSPSSSNSSRSKRPTDYNLIHIQKSIWSSQCEVKQAQERRQERRQVRRQVRSEVEVEHTSLYRKSAHWPAQNLHKEVHQHVSGLLQLSTHGSTHRVHTETSHEGETHLVVACGVILLLCSDVYPLKTILRRWG